MTDAELLGIISRRLSEAGIPFMVVGSVASSYHGEPRFTYDMDIVVEATEEQILRFVRGFDSPFYVSEVAARDAARRRSMFNVIHPQCEYKADIIVSKDRDFDRSQFARRRPATIWGVSVEVASPEDVILAKLEWAKRGESQRQLDDAAKVARTQRTTLDVAYLRKWATVLALDDLLELTLRKAAENGGPV
jgi:hypothetical protein